MKNAPVAPTVNIYPNPANDEINIEFDHVNTGSGISMVNILGQTVYTTNVSANNIKINSHSFAPGVYTILYSTAGGSSSLGKVVVAH